MTNQQLKAYDTAFGLHSRIPKCCVKFYVEEWGVSRLWEMRDQPYVRAVSVASFGYVPCPQCLATGNKVEIRICEKECGRDHREDFVPTRIVDVY